MELRPLTAAGAAPAAALFRDSIFSLCAEIEKACGGRVYTHASITARGFFERRGYALLGENRVFRRGVALINFTMALRVRR